MPDQDREVALDDIASQQIETPASVAVIAEFDGVRLLVDLPDHGLNRGAVGTVLMIHTSPSLAYEVEFMEAEGDTFAVSPPQRASRMQV